MRRKRMQCIDAGSQHCPCRLAALGDCLVCSRLAGHDNCDCDWQGVCIYNEYVQNGCSEVPQRNAKKYKIQKLIMYGKNLAVMRVEVPEGLAEKASFPGSYVFMKNPDAEPFFYAPLSIMKTDLQERYIEVAVQINGPKTRKLLESDDCVELRGIYCNGLLGAEKLTAPGARKVLCLAKGIGLAPLVNYSRWADGKDHIDFVIDTEKISTAFVEECLAGSRVNSVKYSLLPASIKWPEQEQYDIIVLSASDYYHKNIYIPDHKKVVSNNHYMCCGEGICGSCMAVDKDGDHYRMCKCNNIKI